MTNITFFFLLIPFLALALLMVNFIFASHTPYQEKNSTFECGFHSFLGQNRMQFNISFYIFGLLFLLFDLEILLIYPYPVSAQFNSIYGLSVMLIFFLILTLGFTFEFGKNALNIDSRQYHNKSIIYILNNNNNLLSSALFKISRDKWVGLISGLIVLIHFTFAFKYFLNSFDSLIFLLFSGIVSIIAIMLKSIITPCFMNDSRKISYIMENKINFLFNSIIRFMLVVIVTYIITYIISYMFNINGDILFFGSALLCEDFIYQEWIDTVLRIDKILGDPQSRLMKNLNIAKEYDERLSVVKKAHYDAYCVPDITTPEAKQTIADSKLSQEIMQNLLDEKFTEFTKIRGDVRRSAFRIKEKFESLPDSHDGKKFYLDKINKQMSDIKSLASDFENKKIRPNP